MRDILLLAEAQLLNPIAIKLHLQPNTLLKQPDYRYDLQRCITLRHPTPQTRPQPKRHHLILHTSLYLAALIPHIQRRRLRSVILLLKAYQRWQLHICARTRPPIQKLQTRFIRCSQQRSPQARRERRSSWRRIRCARK